MDLKELLYGSVFFLKIFTAKIFVLQTCSRKFFHALIQQQHNNPYFKKKAW